MFYDHYFGQKFTFCKESPLKLTSKKPFYFTEINICEKDYFFGMEIVWIQIQWSPLKMDLKGTKERILVKKSPC